MAWACDAVDAAFGTTTTFVNFVFTAGDLTCDMITWISYLVSTDRTITRIALVRFVLFTVVE